MSPRVCKWESSKSIGSRCPAILQILALLSGALFAFRCSPPLQLAMRTGSEEMLSVALDGIILWDAKVNNRKAAKPIVSYSII